MSRLSLRLPCNVVVCRDEASSAAEASKFFASRGSTLSSLKFPLDLSCSLLVLDYANPWPLDIPHLLQIALYSQVLKIRTSLCLGWGGGGGVLWSTARGREERADVTHGKQPPCLLGLHQTCIECCAHIVIVMLWSPGKPLDLDRRVHARPRLVLLPKLLALRCNQQARI
jgi:hypothetical protein